MSDSAFTSAVELTYETTAAPGMLRLQAPQPVAGDEVGHRAAGPRSGISTVFPGERIFAVSAMKWTPQKTMTSASVAAASCERPEGVAQEVAHLLDLHPLVVVAEDHRVQLRLPAQDPLAQLLVRRGAAYSRAL